MQMYECEERLAPEKGGPISKIMAMNEMANETLTGLRALGDQVQRTDRTTLNQSALHYAKQVCANDTYRQR
jgi:hypothetical protein